MTTRQLGNNPFRDRFVIDDPGVAYLDGNSLGRLPRATVERMQRVISQEWGRELIGSWNQSWLELSRRIGEKIGRLIGASPGETLVCDSTSINLYKMAWALLQNRGSRKTIVTDSANFPTDLYILNGLSQQLAKDLDVHFVQLAQTDHAKVYHQLEAVLNSDTALVCLSHVNYKTGYAFDLPAVTQLVHAHGAPVLWDLSHSAGAIPIDLGAAQIDAAVGCTYKYLNGGPGAPAFLMVRLDLQPMLQNPISGWFGAAQPFDFGANYQPHPGIERFAVGTPPILSLAGIEPGIDLVLEAGMASLRERSWGLMERFFAGFDQRLSPLGFRLETPRDRLACGSHVSLSHTAAWQITQDLIQRYAVVPDFRGPSIIRFGITPLYTIASEIDQAITALESSVKTRSYEAFSSQRFGVT